MTKYDEIKLRRKIKRLPLLGLPPYTSIRMCTAYHVAIQDVLRVLRDVRRRPARDLGRADKMT